MKNFNFKSRNAVSTIIGTFFFVIIMAGAFTAFILMMQTNSGFLNTQLDTTQNEIQKIQGQFTIAAAYDSAKSNRLCVSVKNSGSTPLEIADLFIVNKTNNAVRQFDIDFRDAFVPVSSIKNITYNTPITLKSGTNGITYDIKVVSTSGITQTTELKVFPSSNPDPRFNVTAFVYPVNAASGQNVTVGGHVVNRMNTTLLNVQPNGDPLVDPQEAVALGFNFVTRSNITRLDPNESTMFMWEPEFVGGVGSKLNFTVRVKAQVEGCTGSSYIFNQDSALVKVVPGVQRQILASPETFVSFPNPFGEADTNDQGIFSIVVQNPTDHAFLVSRVSVQMINSKGDDLAGATITGVQPSTGTWTSAVGTFYWTVGATPVRVPPNDIKEWIVRVEAPAPTADAPVNSIIFSTYSSFGQFGKGPFTLGVDSTNTAIVNVYGKSTFSGTTPTFIFTDVPSGTANQRFNFTIQNTGVASVSAGSFLLINIPPGLRDIRSVTTDQPGQGITSGLSVNDNNILEFDDGSVQIPVQVTDAIATDETETYSFRATIPTISVPAFYTFTIAGNGTSSDGNLIGPIAEVVMQVCPTAGTNLCP